MAVKDSDLTAFLTKSEFTAPVIFLYGSDAEFVDSAVTESIDRIKKARPELGAVERLNSDALTASPAVVLDFFDERPLFGDHRFLVLAGVSEKHASLLSQLFKSPAPSPGPQLLICSSALASKSKLLGAARESGFCAMVKAYEAPFTRQDLSSRFAEFGVTAVDPTALDLAHRRLSGDDLASRVQNIRLLSLYAEDGRLTVEDLQACLPPDEDQLTGELLASLLSGDIKGLVAWRRNGEAEGVEPIAQLAFVSRALSEARRARLPASARSSGPPVFWKTDKIVKDASRRLPDLDQRIEKAICAAHRLERAARSSEGLIPEKTERLIIFLGRQFG